MNKWLSSGVLFVLIAIIFLYKPFVIAAFWTWFITPAFSIPVPAFHVVIGLSLLFSFVTSYGKEGVAVIAGETWIKKIVTNGIVMPTVYLAIGYAIHSFI